MDFTEARRLVTEATGDKTRVNGFQDHKYFNVIRVSKAIDGMCTLVDKESGVVSEVLYIEDPELFAGMIPAI